MHKSRLKLVPAGFVLLAGLISCSQEKHTKDVYVAPAPVIRSADGDKDLKSFEEAKIKVLDLQDSFDVGEAAPASVQTRAFCRRGVENFTATFEFHDRHELPVWRLMPEGLLNSEIANLECAFELNLFNGAGSNHLFHISEVPIQERNEPRIHLERRPGLQRGERLDFMNLNGVRVRFRNRSPALGQVVCQDISLRNLPFEQASDLSQFDFLNPESGHDAIALRPLQACRVYILENGDRVAMSSLFRILLPRQALRVEDLPVAARLVSNPFNLDKVVRAVAGGQSLPVQEWRITNTGENTRRLRLPTQGFATSVNAYVRYNYSTHPFQDLVYDTRWLHVIRDPADGSSTPELQLAPGQAVVVQATLVPPGPIFCSAGAVNVISLGLTDFEPLAIDEISAEGEALESLKLKVTPLQLISPSLPKDMTIPQIPSNEAPCSW